MSIKLVAVDVDPEEGVMLRSDFTYLRRYIGLHRFFSHFPHTEAHVRYDLADAFLPDAISSLVLVRYDLLPFRCTISISEPPLLRYLVLGGVQIPIYLVISATDSLGEA